MHHRDQNRFRSQFFFGIVILALGLLFMLDHLDLVDAHDVLRYWPALLILYGFGKVGARGQRGGMGGFLFIIIGALLLLRNLDVISFRIWDYWPLLLVVMGAMLVFRAFGRRRPPINTEGMQVGPVESNSRINAFVVFGGVVRKNSSQDFRGGEITTIMGGCELDLREASIKDGEAVIDVFAFWGGIDIKVPEDWSVSIDSTPLMGGCEDKTHPPRDGASRHLVIRGYIIMGGLEVGQ